MRFLALYRPETGDEGVIPDPAHRTEVGRLTEDLMKTGALIGAEPLAQRSQGARVRRSGGAFAVTEETDRMAGYVFLEAASREEAIELAKAFLNVAGDGVTELRQILEFPRPPG
jgi:hypothetical protein